MDLSHLGALLRTRNVPRFLLASLISRLATGMFALSILMAVLHSGGSHFLAGTTLFAHAIALAAFAPFAGRLADRFDPRRVLKTFAVAHAVAYGGLLLTLASDGPLLLMMAMTVLLGATTPPSAATVRRIWAGLPPQTSKTAFALDTVITSSAFVIGPPIAAALGLIATPVAAVAAGGLARIIGDLVLAGGAVSGVWQTEKSSRNIFGPLTVGCVRLVLIVIALDTLLIGGVQIGATSLTQQALFAGWLIGAYAAGEVLGGIAYGARPWGGQVGRILTLLHAATAVVLVLVGLSEGSFWPMIGLYFGAGFVGGIRDAVGQVALAAFAPAASRTEAFGWLQSFMWGGYALGTLAFGWIATAANDLLFFVGAMVALLAAAGCAGLRDSGSTQVRAIGSGTKDGKATE